MTMNLDDRREQVLETLRPDRLRNHQVSEGLHLNEEQLAELDNLAKVAGNIAGGLYEMSRAAILANLAYTY